MLKLISQFLLAWAVAAPSLLANTYQYNELNQLVRVAYDNGSSVQYDYDPAGNLITVTRLLSGTPDTTKPTLTITNLVAGQRVGNSLFTLRGKAADNVQLSVVNVQINNGVWTYASGTANWSADLNLWPGTNTVRVYAMDGAGNKSLTNTLSLQYVVTNQLQLAITGKGALSPNYSNAWLELGRAYTVTATPSTGFGLANWTSNLLPTTNRAALTFMMQSNLALTANFVDTNKPTVAITNIAAGLQVSNSVFAVKGTAWDNVQVSNVWYQANATAWANPQTTNGWTNWTANLSLTPGTNTIRAYALDSAGNRSLTNTASFGYVLSDTLRIRSVGQGTISPNYSNAVLAIGKSYTLKASAVNGYAFTNWMVSTNWVGGVTSNSATLAFTMQSNLTVQASFVDTNKPTLTITNIPAGLLVSYNVFAAKGTARDNAGVTIVWCQLNGGGWTTATTTNGWTNWTANLSLTPGTNTMRAYALDSAGNRSLTNTASFGYVLSDTLRIRSVGQGTISPNYSNAVLAIGKSYTLKASAVNGYAFTNWMVSTNWVGGVSSNSATLAFTMQSNLTVQASFVDTNKPALSITNLVSGQRVSNALFTVRGKASDNAQVGAVKVQLNSGAWANAAGTTNWTAELMLSPGTNVVRAYAVDGAGNNSPTNSLGFQYVVTNRLSLSVSGLGAVSPNYSNAWLEIGRAYSIASAPAAGFLFGNWTGGTRLPLAVLTNKSGLSFVMQSNLMLVANLLDTNRPTLSITSPANNQRLGGGAVTMGGKAGDNWRVTNAWYQLNTSGWKAVSTTNGYTNWTVAVNLTAGTNTLMAYAQDLGGNYSVTNSIRLVATNVVTLKLIVSDPGALVLPRKTAKGQAAAEEGFAFAVEVSTSVDGRIEYSTDLVHWTNLAPFTGTNQVIKFHDPAAANAGQRFYRAVVP